MTMLEKSNGTIQVMELAPEPFEKIHETGANYPKPDLNNYLYCVRKMVTLDGVPIGFCLARLTSELILAFDRQVPKTARVRALMELQEVMKQELTSLGMDECIAYAEDCPTAAFLMNHMGFKKCQGIPLVKDLNHA
jgi:hypothetical protein